MKNKTFIITLIFFTIVFPVVLRGAISSTERAALISLYNSANGDSWTKNSGWKDGTLEADGFGPIGSEGTWYGVTVASDHVIYLHLQSNNLTGTIPSELGNLSNLADLYLHTNSLTGTLPASLGNLTNLIDLYLSSNQLTGNIPSTLGNLTKLADLWLYSNQLTGSIPSSLGKLTSLKRLLLNGNQLSGSIPKELVTLSSLSRLDLGYNQLSGTIPSELGNLINLTDLNLYFNQLSGKIPSALGNLINLINLNLAGNKLTGSIPPSLGNLINLSELWLQFNGLTGNIPTQMGNLTNLTAFYLHYNQLSDDIPSELGSLTNLIYLSLDYNHLTGGIPSALGNLTNLQRLYLQNNQLSGSIPSSLCNLINLTELWLNSNKLTGNIPTQLGKLINLDCFTLSSNQLSGEIPSNLTNLSGLGRFDSGYNCLWATDSATRAWLNSNDPNWEDTQTIAPSNISADAISVSSINVSWTPIKYNADTGGYRIYYSTSSGGPWTYLGITVNKSVTAYTVTGLNSGTKYYFTVKTRTSSHLNNSNTVMSEFSDKASATTKGLPSPISILTVQSSPETGVSITVSPKDNSSKGNGTTNFTRVYNSGTSVTLTAPSSYKSKDFCKWTVSGTDYFSENIQITINSNLTAKVFYVTLTPPEINLNRSKMDYGGVINGSKTGAQSIIVSNDGGGTLNWAATADVSWLSLIPSSGTGFGAVSVSVNILGLSTGTYNGTIKINDPNVSNSTQAVSVRLKVYGTGQTSEPFGEFATPTDGSTVRSSIPVTGWVVDDVDVLGVKIYNGSSYVGDATFVEGARPDVKNAYPGYPKNYQAGWGYMMLTNFLPGGGNGTYTIHAKAIDAEGHEVALGSKAITIDNANAVKPFGAIDTPTQGGTASGDSFINWGWALTPQPNSIPTSGSTINVYVDGVNLGHPSYNIYRKDISEKFPGYANSDSAIGYFKLDTTAFANGLHTIQWTVTDNAGNTDGVGSRYFTLQNSQTGGGCEVKTARLTEDVSQLPVDYSKPVSIKKGYDPGVVAVEYYPNNDGKLNIELEELEHLEIHFEDNPSTFNIQHPILKNTPSNLYEGYLLVDRKLTSLPLGSTLDIKRGVFCWQPGPGFFGEYNLVFVVRDQCGVLCRRDVSVRIISKFGTTH